MTEQVTLVVGDEQVTFIKLRVRSRFRRAMRWPRIYWSFKRISRVSWVLALKLTHQVIWYEVKGAKWTQMSSSNLNP